MGCPEIYYKKALQDFAYSLFIGYDKKKANYLKNEKSIEKLENEITIAKEKVDTIDFVFDAAVVTGLILECANRDDGCDGFNACLGGLNDFEEFIKNICI